MEFNQSKKFKTMDKIQPIFDLLKNKNNIQKQGIIDYAAEKLQNIIFTVSKANIPTTIKNRNSGLPPNIVSDIKEKRKLRPEFTKTKDIPLKRKLNKKIEESYKNLENELKNPNSQAFNPITDIELDQLIDNLDSKKAPGLDKISNKLLKYVYVSIKSFLLKLFNNSLEHGCYPESFKIALVTMLHKTGKPKNKALSYRPLSLSSCIGKILTSRIKKWAENNSIFNLQQNCFRKNRSTNDNLFKITHSIRQNFNKSMISTVVFFDVKKAFD